MATSPARSRFAKSSNTGTRITLEPGAAQANYPDRKIWIAGTDNSPLLFSQLLRDFIGSNEYLQDDLCIFQSVIYRALTDIPPDTGFRSEDWEALSDATRAETSEPFPTGLLNGGQLTQNGDSNVDVAAGTAVVRQSEDPETIVYTFVAWDNFTAAVNQGALDTEEPLYCAFDDTGAFSVSIVSTRSEFSEFRRNNAILGVVYSHNPSGTNVIKAVVNSPTVGSQLANTYYDQYFIEGGYRKTRGIDVVGSDSDLSLAHDEGTIFNLGFNWHTDQDRANLLEVAAVSPITFRILDRNNVDQTGSDETQVDVQSWDNAGTVEAVPATEATIQYLWWRQDGTYFVQLGQQTYTTFNDALDALSQDSGAFEIASQLRDAIILGAIIATEDSTVLSGSVASRVVTALAVAGNPFLPSGQADTSQFLLLDGTREMVGDLDLGGNNIVDGVGDAGNDLTVAPDFETKQWRGTAAAQEPSNQAGRSGTLAANAVDGRLWIYDEQGTAVPVVLGEIQEHDANAFYRTGRLIQRNGGLERANQDNGPSAYTASDWDPVLSPDAVVESPDLSNDNVIQPTDVAVQNLALKKIENQTARILDVRDHTDASIGGILPTGVPSELLEANIFDVNQAAHSFTLVGQPASFDGSNWTLARADDPNTVGFALVREVLDANNIRLQVGGRMPNIDNTVVAGGTVVPGEVYRVSQSVAGQLTAGTAAAGTLSNVVALALTATDFLMLPYRTVSETGSGTVGNPTFIVVNQVAHPFTKVGQVAHYNGTQWVLGDGNNANSSGVGVIRTVNDADNFEVQLDGEITGLDSTVSDEGGFTAGGYYRVSKSTAGNLTAVQSDIGQNDHIVFQALTSTSAIVVGWRPVMEPRLGSVWSASQNYRLGDTVTYVNVSPFFIITYVAQTSNTGQNPYDDPGSGDWAPIRITRPLTVPEEFFEVNIPGDFADIDAAYEYFSQLIHSSVFIDFIFDDGTYTLTTGDRHIPPAFANGHRWKPLNDPGLFDAIGITPQMGTPGSQTESNWDTQRANWNSPDEATARQNRVNTMDTAVDAWFPVKFIVESDFQLIGPRNVGMDFNLQSLLIECEPGFVNSFGVVSFRSMSITVADCALRRLGGSVIGTGSFYRNRFRDSAIYDNEAGWTGDDCFEVQFFRSSISNNRGDAYTKTRGTLTFTTFFSNPSNLVSGNAGLGIRAFDVQVFLSGTQGFLLEGGGVEGVLFETCQIQGGGWEVNGNDGDGITMRACNVRLTSDTKIYGNDGDGWVADACNIYIDEDRLIVRGNKNNGMDLDCTHVVAFEAEVSDNGSRGWTTQRCNMRIQGSSGNKSKCKNNGNDGMYLQGGFVDADHTDFDGNANQDIDCENGANVSALNAVNLTSTSPTANQLESSTAKRLGCAIDT